MGCVEQAANFAGLLAWRLQAPLRVGHRLKPMPPVERLRAFPRRCPFLGNERSGAVAGAVLNPPYSRASATVV